MPTVVSLKQALQSRAEALRTLDGTWCRILDGADHLGTLVFVTISIRICPLTTASIHSNCVEMALCCRQGGEHRAIPASSTVPGQPREEGQGVQGTAVLPASAIHAFELRAVAAAWLGCAGLGWHSCIPHA